MCVNTIIVLFSIVSQNSLAFLFKTNLHITSPCFNIIHKVTLCLLFVTQNGNGSLILTNNIYCVTICVDGREEEKNSTTNNNAFPCDARFFFHFSQVLHCFFFLARVMMVWITEEQIIFIFLYSHCPEQTSRCHKFWKKSEKKNVRGVCKCGGERIILCGNPHNSIEKKLYQSVRVWGLCLCLYVCEGVCVRK